MLHQKKEMLPLQISTFRQTQLMKSKSYGELALIRGHSFPVFLLQRPPVAISGQGSRYTEAKASLFQYF